uniref:Uncharacterized protein n=1 Tax=Ananas comosus var. bracteatus TaxID=296719 RepID=A0A6V7NH42_ANACO|nr:unnamed protein product [Ananas comosus var. bracteatus]
MSLPMTFDFGAQSRTGEHVSPWLSPECRLVRSDPHNYQLTLAVVSFIPALPYARPDRRRASPATEKPFRTTLSLPLGQPLHHVVVEGLKESSKSERHHPLAETNVRHRRRTPSRLELGFRVRPPLPIGRAAFRRPPATFGALPRHPRAQPAAALPSCGHPDLVRAKAEPTPPPYAPAAMRRARHLFLDLRRRIVAVPGSSGRRLAAGALEPESSLAD